MPSGDLFVISVEERVDRNKKTFLSLRVRVPSDNHLRKRSNSIPAKVWSNNVLAGCIPAPGRVIAADYTEDEYNGEDQLVINRYEIRPSDFSKEKFLDPPAVEQDRVYQKCFEHVWFSDDMNEFFMNLRGLLSAGQDNLKKKLYEIPAGSKNHHSCRAGLLQHIEEIWDFAVQLMQLPPVPTSLRASLLHFPDILDWEIVLAGVVMHDLGKVHDYSPETLDHDEDRFGALYGHTCWGAFVVQHCWPPQGDPDRRALLTHTVLSHHGSLHTGAAIETKIPEATLLHLLDSLSARMDVHRRSELQSLDGVKPAWTKMFGGSVVTSNWPPPLRSRNG